MQIDREQAAPKNPVGKKLVNPVKSMLITPKQYVMMMKMMKMMKMMMMMMMMLSVVVYTLKRQ